MKGQLTFVNIILTVITLFAYGALLPAIQSFITALLPSVDVTTGIVLQITPLIILLLIINSAILQNTSRF